MKDKTYQVIEVPVYKYQRLDPVPDNKVLDKFYKNQYYNLIRKGKGAPELRRLMAGGKEGEQERRWLYETLYTDILYILDKFAPKKQVMDIGCGVGEFIAFLKIKGRKAAGIEPSLEAAATAQNRGLDVQAATLEELVKARKKAKAKKYGAVTLFNVLEHTPYPEKVIKLVKEILEPQGIICVRVPNDFSEIQMAAHKKIGGKQWWVAPPDHINYFNVKSLQNTLEQLGFEVIYTQCDYPMEFFLLQGDNYTNDPELGSKCHWKRVRLETSISGDLRRSMYQALAAAGIGRDCVMFGRLKK
jgi:2-polyprenyl-3-methyl-5-hydroxy-6-metoxy-1,4-benzoquinol methylase